MKGRAGPKYQQATCPGPVPHAPEGLLSQLERLPLLLSGGPVLLAMPILAPIHDLALQSIHVSVTLALRVLGYIVEAQEGGHAWPKVWHARGPCEIDFGT